MKYVQENTGVNELKPLLTNPKIMKIYRELLILLKYVKGIKKLLIVSYKSKDILFVKENLEMPILYLFNKFLEYFKLHGTAFNYKLSILLLDLLYFDFSMPFSPEGNSLEDNTISYKDPNAPSKMLYWKLLTNIWNTKEFRHKDMYLVRKCKFSPIFD